MAGFKTHITVSTTLGAAYGVAGWYYFDVPEVIPTCILSAGLCSVSGMLPDIDSDSGVPFRESMAFAAAVIPMLMMDRFQAMGWSHETMALVGGLIYVFIRFGVARFLRKYTVHRGMFHSIPAAIIASQVAFLVCSCEDLSLRYYKAGAVFLGFMSHLLLDEIWSLQMVRGQLKAKKSFGTAVKLWGRRSLWANISTYAKLIMLTYVVVRDPVWMGTLDPHEHEVHHIANQQTDDVLEEVQVWR